MHKIIYQFTGENGEFTIEGEYDWVMSQWDMLKMNGAILIKIEFIEEA